MRQRPAQRSLRSLPPDVGMGVVTSVEMSMVRVSRGGPLGNGGGSSCQDGERQALFPWCAWVVRSPSVVRTWLPTWRHASAARAQAPPDSSRVRRPSRRARPPPCPPVAEGEGFEPPRAWRPLRFSRPLRSTTPASLHRSARRTSPVSHTPVGASSPGAPRVGPRDLRCDRGGSPPRSARRSSPPGSGAGRAPASRGRGPRRGRRAGR